MLDVHFVILGALIGALGEGLYVRDMRRGDTRPNRVTWLLWAVAPLLAFAVEIRSGVGLRALMTFTVGFGPLVVFAMSFSRSSGPWRLRPLDYLCATLSVLGTLAWLATRQGWVALAASIAADGLAALPTVVKSWRQPESESANVYVGSMANAGLTLLTVRHVSAPVVAFPLYILVLTTLQVLLVAGRAGPRLRRRRRRRRNWSSAKASPRRDWPS